MQRTGWMYRRCQLLLLLRLCVASVVFTTLLRGGNQYPSILTSPGAFLVHNAVPTLTALDRILGLYDVVRPAVFGRQPISQVQARRFMSQRHGREKGAIFWTHNVDQSVTRCHRVGRRGPAFIDHEHVKHVCHSSHDWHCICTRPCGLGPW